MEIINTIVGTPLGYLMKFCYDLLNDYGLAIIFFTLLTKVIMFPISLLVQKNSIKMVKMKPKLDALKYQYVDDKDALADAQSALYKEEKYSPMAGVWPLLLQLPIIFGLLDVIYKPLKHLLHLPADVQKVLVKTASVISETTVEELGSTAQLKVVELIKKSPELFGEVADEQTIEAISALKTDFLGMNLADNPTAATWFIVPILAGLSALIMCYIQNKINVLQVEQNKASQWGMTIFMILFSGYFALIVPNGVGLYWAFGNLFSIIVMYLVNAIYSPKKYINYTVLEEMKATAAENKEQAKKNKILAKKYYKEFFAPENVKDMKLVFYAEGSGYYKYMQNIIEQIINKSDITIHYVTSDPNDAIFKMNEPQIKPYYVDETRLISLMMKLECDVVVMTTPDLEKYHIKRSRIKPNIEYIYVDHGCSSINLTYRTGALDAFNTIFAVSPDQAIEIRELEKLRNSKKKRIIECGYGLLDNMIKSYEASDKVENEKKTILIGPSWQYDNIMDSCLDDLIDSLYGKGYKIVIRPHPQYVRRFPMKIKEILEKHKDKLSEDFIIETDFSSNVTVYTADLLITDWSAIAFEFAFTTDKPALFINTEMKVVNKDYKQIRLVPFDITAREKLGRSLNKDEVKNAHEAVADLIKNRENYRQHIIDTKDDYFYNLGNSGEVGADYIIKRINAKQRAKEISTI